MKAYIVEKTLQIFVSEDDLEPDEELTPDTAMSVAAEIDTSEWVQVDIDVVGITEI